jgi:hypothetical protein
MIEIVPQFSPTAMSPEPVVGWITATSRPTLAEKKATTTEHGTAAPDDLELQV